MNRTKVNLLRSVFLFIISLICLNVSAQQFDTVAIKVLDNMSNYINGIESCSFKMNIEFDKYSNSTGLVTHSEEANVFLRGPDRLRVNLIGDNGHKEYYYNGKEFMYYSFDNNQYSAIPAPATNIQTIEMLHKDYGYDFPAADFFYPYFVDDLLTASNNLLFLGMTKVNDKECFHLAGTTTDNSMTYQFWITKDASYLPAKLVIVYINQPGSPQYEAVIHDWNVNPVIPESMFEFSAPSGSKKISLKKNN